MSGTRGTRPVGWSPVRWPWERRRWEAATRELHQTRRRVAAAEVRAPTTDVLTLAEFERTRVEVEALLQRHRRAFGWRRVMRRAVAGFLALGPDPALRLAMRVVQQGVDGDEETRSGIIEEIEELAEAADRGSGVGSREEAALLRRTMVEVEGLDDVQIDQLAGLCVARPPRPALARLAEHLGVSADLQSVLRKYLSREYAPDIESAAARRMEARLRAP